MGAKMAPNREDASTMVAAGATANITEGNSRATRESGLLCSHSQTVYNTKGTRAQKERNKALTLAHAQTIHYTSN